MKATLLLLLALLTFSLGQRVRRKTRRQKHEGNYASLLRFEKAKEANSIPSAFKPSKNYKPTGRQICKCCRYMRGKCIDMNCCQKYRASSVRYPTLNKPKNCVSFV
eukprot:TRINITY_DN6531_c0_g4_i1.p2 TRINITY_DN6531_c0_g4~~TRINITY_DN6531_c0_g4_i1.p2  ORF type:complete len:106 (-),score=7.92 TRINITY_DN6531_c0_g4_i1:67-384(-)